MGAPGGRPAGFDPERYAAAFAPAGAVGLAAGIALGGAAGLAVAALGVTLLVLACWSRADGVLLFGPFLRAELTRLSRKQRVHLWRTLALLVVVLPVLAVYTLAAGPVPDDYRIPRRVVRAAAEGMFLAVAWHLFLILTSVTATFLSTAVTEEREANRLDFLLVTDLRNREVVIGKSATRAVGAVSYFVPAVPVVLMLPGLFGVDPALIFYTAGYAGVTVFSIAGVAALGSVMAKTKKQSGGQQFKYLMPYLVLGWALDHLRNYPAVWLFPGGPTAAAPYTVGDAVEVFNAGHPFLLASGWVMAAVAGPNLGPMAAAFPGYAAFHVGAGLFAFLLAARRLRGKAAEFAGEGPPPAVEAYAAKRPAVYDRPVVWKEMYAVPPQFLTKSGRIQAYVALVILVIVPATIFLGAAVSDLGGLADGVRQVARFVLPVIAWIGIAHGMTTAAHAVAKERERDTLTSLQLTTLDPPELLWEKFLGVLGATRGLVYWQLLVGVPAVLNGAFTWWAFLGLLVTQAVLTAGAVALGLVASAKATATEKAARWVGMALGIGTGVSTMVAGLLLAAAAGSGDAFLYLVVGMTPPAALLAFGQAHLAAPGTLPYWAAGIAAGWVVYGFVAWLLWRWARRRFLKACELAREGGAPPEPAPPPAGTT